MPEEKESISITKLSASSAEYWYPFVWSETKILWVPMFFCSDSKTSWEEEKPSKFYRNQTHNDRTNQFIKEHMTEKLKYPNKDTNFQWNSCCKRETKEKKNLTNSEISSMSITS